MVRLLTSTANTSGVTLNVNGLGVENVVSKNGQVLTPGQLPGRMIAEFIYDGINYQMAVPFAVLGGPKTYYVNAATGNDTNDGLAGGRPFAIVQRAINEAATWQPNSSYAITISLAPRTYAGYTTPEWSFPSVVIDGGSASSTTLTVATQYLCSATGKNTITLKNMSLSNTSNGNFARCVFSTSGATIILDAVEFMGMPNSLNGAFCFTSAGGRITVLSCTLSRNAYTYFFAGGSSQILLSSATVTISCAIISVRSFVGADALG